MRFFGEKEIKTHVRHLLESRQSEIKDHDVLDLPSGNGFSLEILKGLGARAVGGDLFPELNRAPGTRVEAADLTTRLPFSNESFDLVLCQEGIEHVGNQDFVFAEFSRILRKSGSLILTTPNYSNLKSKLSYLLTESEAFGRIMPPNEVDSIWISNSGQSRVYFGHVFLTGLMRLRLFGLMSGFSIRRIHDSRVNYTSLLLFPFLYPFILLFALKTYFRFRRKNRRREVANSLLKYMISPKLLLENHLIIEFEKTSSLDEALKKFGSAYDASMTT